MMIEDTRKNQGDNSEDLYAWIDTIPSSKSKRNLTRDFSDAEVLKFHYPKHVELHNYIPASNLNTKKDNWSTLNRKVLSKIDIKLSKERINQLANAHQGAIERLLLEIREKIFNRAPINRESMDESNGAHDPEEEDKNQPDPSESSSCATEPAEDAPSTEPSLFSRFKRAALATAKFLLGWICLWNLFVVLRAVPRLKKLPFTSTKSVADASTERSGPECPETDDVVPRLLCTQLKQELRERNDVICTLNHKVAYLESAMKLKDLRISHLTSQILQSAVEMDQFAKAQGKPRTRSTNQETRTS